MFGLQEARVMNEFHKGLYLIPPEEIATGGVTSEMARRWQVLQNLQVQYGDQHLHTPWKLLSRPEKDQCQACRGIMTCEPG